MFQKYFVKLTSEERLYLEKLVSCGEAPARKIRCARILLKSDCSEGGPNWTYEAICDAFDVNPVTVANIRKAFVEGGLEQALNRKQPEREYEHRLDGHAEAHLVAMVCGKVPDGFDRWSLRMLQERFVKLQIVERIVLYSTHCQRRICLPHGRCFGGVHPTL
jgi:Fe2+ or Zn2+ uptake regulation protein